MKVTRGIDLLGLQHEKMKSKVYAKHWPDGVGLGVLLDAFSRKPTDLTHIDDILKTGKCPYVRGQIFNWTAVRNNFYGDADFLRRYGSPEAVQKAIVTGDKRFYSELKRRDDKLRNLCAKRGVKYEMSPLLEHNLDAGTMKELYERYPFEINNPMTGIQIGPWKHEKHGSRIDRKSYLYSQDGSDARLYRSIELFNKADEDTMVFYWDGPCNLGGNGKRVPPLLRKNAPSARYFQSIVAVVTSELPKPSRHRKRRREDIGPKGWKVNKIGRKQIWKSHDEHDNKPVALLEIRRKSIDIIDKAGRVIGVMQGHGKFSHDPSLYRYYIAKGRGGSGQWGFQLANRARRRTKCPTVYLVTDKRKKECIEILDPSGRWGAEKK